MLVLKNRRTRLRTYLGLICVVPILYPASPVFAESQQEFLLFPSIDTFDTFEESDPLVEDSFVRGSLDLLYSFSTDKFRFLGEYLLSSEESELERLKAGWEFRDGAMLWLGRTHTTSKHWTSEYHHGQFLQTSITRPSLEEWEDESGPIPSHVTGVSLDMRHALKSEGSFNYVISAGLAPKFVGEELAPFDILDPESGHGTSLNAKLSYKPHMFEMMQVGLISSWNDINVDSASSPSLAELRQIQQFTIGAFADWQWAKLRLIASYVHFENELEYFDEVVNDNFDLGYLQLEYRANDDFTLFGRSDNGFGEDWSPYLRLLPAFISHRHMLGLRWDFADNHALTVEIADTAQQAIVTDHEYFKEIRLQWSAVF
jgi:hypothetical protein